MPFVGPHRADQVCTQVYGSCCTGQAQPNAPAARSVCTWSGGRPNTSFNTACVSSPMAGTQPRKCEWLAAGRIDPRQRHRRGRGGVDRPRLWWHHFWSRAARLARRLRRIDRFRAAGGGGRGDCRAGSQSAGAGGRRQRQVHAAVAVDDGARGPECLGADLRQSLLPDFARRVQSGRCRRPRASAPRTC